LLNFETKKLFYNKYLYKLVIHNQLAVIFRDKNLNYARKELDLLQQVVDEKNQIVKTWGFNRETYIDRRHFEDAKILLNIFSHLDHDEYKLRIERNDMCLYTNSTSVVNNVCSKITIDELWQPNLKHLNLLEKNVLLVDGPFDYEYKVYFNARTIDENFYNWITRNSDKVKIGKIALEEVKKGFAPNLYMYVRDEKVLQLISLLVGHNFQSVQRVISTQNIDK